MNMIVTVDIRPSTDETFVEHDDSHDSKVRNEGKDAVQQKECSV